MFESSPVMTRGNVEKINKKHRRSRSKNKNTSDVLNVNTISNRCFLMSMSQETLLEIYIYIYIDGTISLTYADYDVEFVD